MKLTTLTMFDIILAKKLNFCQMRKESNISKGKEKKKMFRYFVDENAILIYLIIIVGYVILNKNIDYMILLIIYIICHLIMFPLKLRKEKNNKKREE